MTVRYELGALIPDFYVELKIGIFTEFSRSAWSDHSILSELLSKFLRRLIATVTAPDKRLDWLIAVL